MFIQGNKIVKFSSFLNSVKGLCCLFFLTPVRNVARFSVGKVIRYLKSRVKRACRYCDGLAKGLQNKRVIRIASEIENSADPTQKFSLLQKKRTISSGILWKIILYLNDKRSPVYDLILKERNVIENEEVRLLLRLRESLSSPSPVSGFEVNKFLGYYSARKTTLKNKKEYRRLLITLISKKLPAAQAYDALECAGLVEKFTVHEVLKMLNKASLEGEGEVFFALKKQYLKNMNSSAKVKLMYWEARLSNKSVQGYKAIEKNFCHLNKVLSEEFNKYLLALFDAIPEEKMFLDCQIEKRKLNNLKVSIEEAIQQQKSFSFVRLNDGEGYGFPQTLPCAFDMERQELHWWGEVLDAALRRKIQEDFRRSLHQHDFVGIPSVLRFIDELNINRDNSIFNNHLLCRLFTACHGYLNNYDGKSYVTEGQINLYLFDKEYIIRLANLARRVVFISGAKKEYLQTVFIDFQHATYVELPTHRLLKNEKFSCSGATQPLPYVYEQYLEQIRKLAGPGVVFFVSAGFIGKIFAAEIAKSGGIALDVGQVMMNIVANNADV
jgi:hypothetical protein